MSTVTALNWRTQAACRTADPDLFFPEKDTPVEDIDQAKQICASCPVMQMCLDEAFRTNDRAGICGGLTPVERERMLSPTSGLSRFQVRRAENRTARTIAMTRGAEMLLWLVERQMSVPDVAERLETVPRAVYQAWRMLVPAGRPRPLAGSAVERVLEESSLRLRALEKSGRSHDEIAAELGTSQNVVSACVRVLVQRDAAVDHLADSGAGIEASVKRVQDEESRVRQQSGAGLTIDDVIEIAGAQIRQKHAEGVPLRKLAEQLGMCRETVRRAHLQMTGARRVNELTRNDMRSAA